MNRFLRAILENPADDTPRLVLADWLDDQDENPLRAEFIRIQCKLSACDDSQLMEILRRRELELLEEPTALRDTIEPEQWKLAICKAGSKWHWKRGFISEISCPRNDFLIHAKEIFTNQPVEHVTLSDRNPALVHTLGTYLNFFSWFRFDHGESQGTIPEELGQKAYRTDFTDRSAAFDYLSDLCVRYGRQQAELPPK